MIKGIVRDIVQPVVSTIVGNSCVAPWTQQRIADTFLFYAETSKISGGRLYNQVKGSSDYLTVGGSTGSETYQAPNNATYKTADTDKIWFTTVAQTQRTVTTAELIGYDLQRTPVKYLDDSPNTIEEIIILKTGEVLTAGERDQLFKYMHLSIFWDDSLNTYGRIKSNRIGQNLWVPDSVGPAIPTGLTLSLISGGVKYDWTAGDAAAQTEVWCRSDSGAYTVVTYTINAGTVTKSETIAPVDLRYCKIRSLKGGVYSDFTAEQSIAMLGAELILNGGFDNTNNWTAAAGWTITGGTANLNAAANNYNSINQAILTATKTYLTKFEMSGRTSGGVLLYLGSAGIGSAIVSNGSKSITGVCTGNSTFAILCDGGASVLSIDNVSCKNVLNP